AGRVGGLGQRRDALSRTEAPASLALVVSSTVVILLGFAAGAHPEERLGPLAGQAALVGTLDERRLQPVAPAGQQLGELLALDRGVAAHLRGRLGRGDRGGRRGAPGGERLAMALEQRVTGVREPALHPAHLLGEGEANEAADHPADAAEEALPSRGVEVVV